jgi:hypothetical protein
MKKFNEYLEAVQENKDLEVQNEGYGVMDFLEKYALKIGLATLGATAIATPMITALGICLAFLISIIVDPYYLKDFLDWLKTYISDNSNKFKNMSFKERYTESKKTLITKLLNLEIEKGSNNDSSPNSK